MNTPLTLTCRIQFGREAQGGRTTIESQPAKAKSVPTGRVPRVARLMALAIRLDGLIRSGELPDQATVARLGRVSRARVTQIMNLLFLAPDIQEQLLFHSVAASEWSPILICDLQPIARELDWRVQRRLWQQLFAARVAK
jgi:hypothetical protein